MLFCIACLLSFALGIAGKNIDAGCTDQVLDVSSLEKKDSFVFVSHKNFGKRPYKKKEDCTANFRVSLCTSWENIFWILHCLDYK